MKREDWQKFAPMPKRSYDLMMAVAQSVQEEKIQKKKVSWGLVFALVLVCIAAVALAATMLDLMKASHEKQLQDGHIDFWTIEERYAFEQPYVDSLLAEADNPYHMPLNGLPDESDVQQDEAREIAVNAVKQEFGDNAFDDGRVWGEKESVYFFVYFGNERDGDREWRFAFYSRAAESKQDPIWHYEVWIDAKTGEVTKAFTDTDFLENNPGR